MNFGCVGLLVWGIINNKVIIEFLKVFCLVWVEILLMERNIFFLIKLVVMSCWLVYVVVKNFILIVVFFFWCDVNLLKFFGIGVMFFFLEFEKIFVDVVGKINENLSGFFRVIKLNVSFYVLSLNFI